MQDFTSFLPSNDEAEYQASVLLVDDNELTLLCGRRCLEMLGCTVTVARNGQEALDEVRARPFDLILMDGHMPVMDGPEATIAIRRLPSPIRDVPIIGTTTTPHLIGRCRAMGMNEFVTKPFCIDEIEETLKRWCERTLSPAMAR